MTTPIDKPTIREQLDAVRPDSDDLRDAGLRAAARLVEQAAVNSQGTPWRDVFDRQQTFDREVAATLQDVDVPESLSSRLLAALETVRPSESFAALDGVAHTTPKSRRSRRRLLVTVATLLLAAGLGWFMGIPGPQTMTLDELRQSLPLDGAGHIDRADLSDFDQQVFMAPLPSRQWVGWQTTSEKGLDLDGDGTHDVAVYAFSVKGITGDLVVLPASLLSDPPIRTYFSTAGISYTPLRNVAWVDLSGETAYICFIRTGDPETLARLLRPQSA